MEAIAFLFLSISMATLATLYWTATQEINLYKELCEKCEDSIKKLTREKAILKLENMQLRDKLLLDSMYKSSSKSTTDKEIMDAVKYAMKVAHPDNGGKQEDFIKFNALYNKIR